MNKYAVMKNHSARFLVAVVVPLMLAACGKQEATPTQPLAQSVPAASSAAHLLLTVPEGAQAPEALVDIAQPGANASSEVPWVRSLKREAPSGFQYLSAVGFDDDTSLQAWRTAHAATLGAPMTLKRARVLVESETATSGSAQSMFKISYYSLVAPVSEFQKWVDGYLAKYLAAQRTAGILTSYVMYLEEDDHGRALLVLEYPDAATEQSAEPIKEKLSEQLAASDAAYAELMPLKEELRTTQSWTLAVPATPGAG